MMKKVILCTVVSLFVFSGLVAGPWGPDLAGAAKECPGKDVEACILINTDGTVELVPGPNKKLRKPKQHGKPEEPADPVVEPDDQPKSKLPNTIKDSEEYDKYGDKFKTHQITIYAGNTCGNFGGAWICW